MIYRNRILVLEIQKEIRQIYNGTTEHVQRHFGAIYRGSRLVWKTVYNGIKSCYGSGIWISDKLWIDDDLWKIN